LQRFFATLIAVKRALQILLCAALATGSAWLEAADGAAGVGASTEGGASLGGTGIGSADPRKEKEADQRFKIQRKPAADVDKAVDKAADKPVDQTAGKTGKPRDRKKDRK